MSLSTLDIFILVPLLYGAYKGYKKGVIMEGISILSLILGLLVGFKLLNTSIQYLKPYIAPQLGTRALPYLGFLAVFLPTFYLTHKIGYLFRNSLRKTFIGTFDSLGGGLLGVLTWGFGLSMILWTGTQIGIKVPQDQIKTSKLYTYIEPVAPKIISKLSDIIPAGGNIIEYFKAFRKKEDLGL
jgi:membrane protein required for colicin V production